RDVRRRSRVRPPAGARRGGLAARARPGRNPGRRPEVELRHDGEAAACRPRGVGGPAGRGARARRGLVSARRARGGSRARAPTSGSELSAASICALPDRLLIRDTLFKYHAACYLTHAAIEAARRLRERHALDPEKVAAVEVLVNPTLLGVCNIEAPRTGLEG